jgi:hypothetical protein
MEKFEKLKNLGRGSQVRQPPPRTVAAEREAVRMDARLTPRHATRVR